MRALLFGGAAAIAGLILYATFAIVTGIMIGYISLAVGWMVGKAMMKGSNGVGGRRYQIAAVLLTYAAVSMAAIPIWIHYAGQNRQQTQRQKLEEEQRQLEAESGRQSSQPTPQPEQPHIGLGAWLGRVVLLGLASPFIEVWGGGPSFSWLIGLVILFVGMRFAWRITAGLPLVIYGPFQSGS
jgi:divalent metal cation (Fe/Co/Zn/Cd) transporter